MLIRVLQLTEYGYTYEVVTISDPCWNMLEPYRSTEYQIQVMHNSVWVPLDKNQSLSQ